MPEAIEVLDGEYVLVQQHRSPGAFVAEVRHVLRRGPQTIYTPVAHLFAFTHPGADMIRSHWCVRLLVSASARYEASTKTTSLVYNPEQQAGENTDLLKHLVALRDGDLPGVHAALPRAVGAHLLRQQFAPNQLPYIFTTAQIKPLLSSARSIPMMIDQTPNQSFKRDAPSARPLTLR
jgi:hypothetical protein